MVTVGMDDIIESIINGQRKQALEQLKESPWYLIDLIEELQERDLDNEILSIVRVADNHGYIKI